MDEQRARELWEEASGIYGHRGTMPSLENWARQQTGSEQEQKYRRRILQYVQSHRLFSIVPILIDHYIEDLPPNIVHQLV